MINYDEEPGVKVELTKNGSILMVNKTKPSHGGNYTCSPSNAKPAYVMVHVIEGERIDVIRVLSKSHLRRINTVDCHAHFLWCVQEGGGHIILST